MTSSFSDDELVDAHLAGSPDAFTELVQRHQDHLWRQADRTLGDPHEAHDAVQDALLSAYRGLGSFERKSSVRTWLTRITLNRCMRIMRKQRSTPVSDPDAVMTADTRRAVDRDLDLALKQAIGRLPEEQRLAIMLVDVGGWPNSDVAAELGIKESTLRSQRSRGRDAVRRTLDDRPQDHRRDTDPGGAEDE